MIKELLVSAQVVLMVQNYLKNGNYEELVDEKKLKIKEIKFESIEHTVFKNKVVRQKNIKEFIDYLMKQKCNTIAINISDNIDKDLCGVVNGMPCSIYVEYKDLSYMYFKTVEVDKEGNYSYSYNAKICAVRNSWKEFDIDILKEELQLTKEYFEKIECKKEEKRMGTSIEYLNEVDNIKEEYYKLLPKAYYKTTVALFAALVNAYYFGEEFDPKDKVIENTLKMGCSEEYYERTKRLNKVLNDAFMYVINITRRC
ncbi:MAG: hypothetical protein RSG07_04470 [Erysipelotrichaceae bacterium]